MRATAGLSAQLLLGPFGSTAERSHPKVGSTVGEQVNTNGGKRRGLLREMDLKDRLWVRNDACPALDVGVVHFCGGVLGVFVSLCSLSHSLLRAQAARRPIPATVPRSRPPAVGTSRRWASRRHAARSRADLALEGSHFFGGKVLAHSLSPTRHRWK